MRIKFKRKKGKFEYLDKCRVLNFFSLGGFLLRKKSEKCIAFLVPSLHCKLALFRVTYALRATFIPSLRFGTGYANPYNPCHCLKLKNSKLNLIESSCVIFFVSAMIKATAKMNDITSLIRDAQSIVTIL